jgi:hypothetical protein
MAERLTKILAQADEGDVKVVWRSPQVLLGLLLLCRVFARQASIQQAQPRPESGMTCITRLLLLSLSNETHNRRPLQHQRVAAVPTDVGDMKTPWISALRGEGMAGT